MCLDGSNILCSQVLFEGKRATGVEFLWQGAVRNVSASREVIISAGALDSPKVLMLSGVGHKEHLKEMGVGACYKEQQ